VKRYNSNKPSVAVIPQIQKKKDNDKVKTVQRHSEVNESVELKSDTKQVSDGYIPRRSKS